MTISESYKNRLKTLSGIVSEVVSNITEVNVEDITIPSDYIKDSLNQKIWDGDKLNTEIIPTLNENSLNLLCTKSI